jgi:esterase/lipase superfamily enzyme
MHTEHHQWWSPHLNRDMALKVYGHWGKPFVVFPCSRGRYFDYEGMGMIDAVSGFIDAGKIKLFCVDSVDESSWYNFAASPADRNARHEAYDRYVAQEVIPFIRDHCQSLQERPMANGCSMGAYHAVNFFLKHPDLFEGTIALSGLYRLDRPEFQLTGEDLPAVYFNSPLSYLPGLADAAYLEAYRRSRIVVCVGQGAWEEETGEDTRGLDALFRAKSVPAWVDLWGPDVNHDWPWWYRQMNYFLGKLYG